MEEEEYQGPLAHLDDDDTSGEPEPAKVLVRMPKPLQRKLKGAASEHNRSLNAEILTRLAATPERTGEGPDLHRLIAALRNDVARLARDVERMSDIIALLVKMQGNGSDRA
ncbi:Arc family DNA-binding protein [Xanthobacter oligotrophicus]|uniref:Arc family DNA-binding protein n=1 Tax=Xanthobacter oligotrophicus TaxID=2607286 RepID=A0ABW6ZTW7_9HYPH